MNQQTVAPYFLSPPDNNNIATMKAWYVNKNPVLKNWENESLIFFIFYLLADEFNMSCMLSDYVNKYKNLNSFDDKTLIEKFTSAPSDNPNKPTKEEMFAVLKNVQKIKKRTNKNREDLKAINWHNEAMEKIKGVVALDFQIFFEDAGFWQWMELLETGIVNMLPFVVEKSDENKKNEHYVDLIKKQIFSKSDFPVFDPFVMKDFQLLSWGIELEKTAAAAAEQAAKNKAAVKQSKNKWLKKTLDILYIVVSIIPMAIYSLIFFRKTKRKIKHIEAIQEEAEKAKTTPKLYSICLCRIPESDLITADKAKLIRSNLHEKMQPIKEMLGEFKAEMSQIEFDGRIPEKTLALYVKNREELRNLQQHIYNEPYFQQLVNSTKNYLYYELHAAAASIEQITHFYENNGVLLPYVGDALRRNLSLQIDINKCDVYLFWHYRSDKK